MSKNLADLSFYVTTDEGQRSTAWRLWITKKGDVYLTQGQMGGILKYSFHVSGICTEAFTSEYSAKRNRPTRSLHRWRRSLVDQTIALHASRVASIAVPSSLLSRLPDPPPVDAMKVPAAPPHQATVIELLYTRSDLNSLTAAICQQEIKVMLFQPLQTDENFVAWWYHVTFEMDLNRIERDPGTPDLIVSPLDPANTGRPVRVSIKSHPQDGECVEVTDVGAFPERA